MEIKKLNKFILLICLSFYSLTVSAAKTDEVTILPHTEKTFSRKEQIKKWINEHKLITAIAATLTLAGIGTSAYFIHKKLSKKPEPKPQQPEPQKLKNLDILANSTKPNIDRLNAAKHIYEERILKIEEGLNTFNNSSDESKKREIAQELYKYLPESVKTEIETDIKKNNPQIILKENESFAEFLKTERLVELANLYINGPLGFKSKLDDLNFTLQALSNLQKLRKEKPHLVESYYGTPEKMQSTINIDLEAAKGNLTR